MLYKRSFPQYANCLLGIVYLYLRGKCKSVIFVSSHTMFFPWHFLARNGRGDIVHFQYVRLIQGLWFLGQYRGISRQKYSRYLKMQKRREVRVMNAHLFVFLTMLFFASVSIPWMLGWVLYCPLRFSYDTVTALWKRFKRL